MNYNFFTFSQDGENFLKYDSGPGNWPGILSRDCSLPLPLLSPHAMSEDVCFIGDKLYTVGLFYKAFCHSIKISRLMFDGTSEEY